MIAAVLAAAIAFGATPPAAAPSTPAETTAPASEQAAPEASPPPASAQPSSAAPSAPRIAVIPAAPAEGPDVELHVPHAEISKLGLEVENLQARLDIDTAVAGLVRINAGVVATVQTLKVQLEGVQAETHLVVRLNRVADVMERALAAIDEKPQLAAMPAAAPAPEPGPAASAVPAAGVAVGASVEPIPAPVSTKPPTE